MHSIELWKIQLLWWSFAQLTLRLRALLGVDQWPTSGNYEYQADFPSTNTTRGSSPYTWVLSHDLLRNFSHPGSQYFLGLTTIGKPVGVVFNYALGVFWAKCLLLDDRENNWRSSGCKVKC